MAYELQKAFRFESAHRLGKGYNGKCSNIHGHSWNGSIKVSVPSLDEFGMGIDYTVLGKFTKAIENELDHKLLLDKSDEKLIELCKQEGYAVVVFNGNPTSENIAKYIYNTLEAYMLTLNSIGAFVVSVTVEETCTTACTYTQK